MAGIKKSQDHEGANLIAATARPVFRYRSPETFVCCFAAGFVVRSTMASVRLRGHRWEAYRRKGGGQSVVPGDLFTTLAQAFLAGAVVAASSAGALIRLPRLSSASTFLRHQTSPHFLIHF